MPMKAPHRKVLPPGFIPKRGRSDRQAELHRAMLNAMPMTEKEHKRMTAKHRRLINAVWRYLCP